MSAASIGFDEVPVTRHSPDDDLLSVRVFVAELLGPGEHLFNITRDEADRLVAFVEATR